MPSNLVIDVHIFQCHTPCNDRIPPPTSPQIQASTTTAMAQKCSAEIISTKGRKKLTVK